MMSSKIISIILTILIVAAGGASAFDTLYVDAELDTLRKDISGTVIYTLPETPITYSFEFQLFANVYASENSPYLRNKSKLAGMLKNSGKRGEMKIDSVLLDGRNVSSIIQIDYTRLMFRPEEESRLNGREVKIFFRTRIPEMADRLFYYGDAYFLDGWFPYPAILLDDGTWYNPYYDTFAEPTGGYFHFDIKLHLPDNMVIAAPVTPEIIASDGTLKACRFAFGPAHDFVLGLSPDYMVDSSLTGDIETKIYYRSFEQPVLDRIKTAAHHAIEYMTEHVGEYIYDDLTYVLIDMVEAGGVELPGLIGLGSPRGGALVSRYYESLVIHETIHQWFYAAVNTDQIKTPWMDESVTSFFTLKVMEKYYGVEANSLDFAGFKLSERDQLRAMSSMSRDYGPLNRPTDAFADGHDFFGTIYSRGALILETFDNLLTDTLSSSFWSEYYRRYKFDTPSPEDFTTLAGETAGAEIKTALEKLIDGAGDIDYSVTNLTNEQIDSVTFEIKFTLGCKGDIDYPVKYSPVLYNNDTVDYFWAPEYNSENITLRLAAPANEIIVDPDHIFAVDDNLLNNSVTYGADSRAGFRLSSGVMFLIESLFSFVGGM